MIDYLILDVDNTLYPQSTGLGGEMSRLMTGFVARFLGVEEAAAENLRREARQRHGTTLAWLLEEAGLEHADPYLEAVHPTDLSPWITDEHAEEARAVLSTIDLPASVLTNSPIEHAERVIDRLGLSDRFDRIFDLRSNGFVGKPAPSVYQRVLDELEIRANTTLFVDDMVQYLLPFRDLGGNVVHVTAAGPSDTEIPTIEALRDLVPIIYPSRSRG
ncbi:MAG: HAD-IA family hydrolase [Spirochaetota bacterium]